MRKRAGRKLSGEKREALKALARLPDEKIDFSDIPEIRELPSDLVIGKFYRPRKTAVTIRLDSDVLAWLKASGAGIRLASTTICASVCGETGRVRIAI